MLMDKESELSWKERNFSLLHYVQTGSQAHGLPIERMYEALSPVVKRLEREAHYSPAPRAELKNAWIFTFISLYVFVTWLNTRTNFARTLLVMPM
jgi:hypothetical protein